MDTTLWSFIVISAVVIVTPGPDTALTIRNILAGGRSGGVFTALGVAAGQAVWALAASAGVVSILLASETLFRAVKIAGAFYLVYLGARSLLAALRGRNAPIAIERGKLPARLVGPVAFRQGFISNLANPKMAVFFASILPQFVPRGGAVFGALLVVGFLFCSMTLAWLTLYAVVLSKVQETLIKPRAQRFIEAITGAALLVLGLRLASAER